LIRLKIPLQPKRFYLPNRLLWKFHERKKKQYLRQFLIMRIAGNISIEMAVWLMLKVAVFAEVASSLRF